MHTNSTIHWLLYDSSMSDEPNHLPYEQIAGELPASLLHGFWNALLDVNPLVHALHCLASMDQNLIPDTQLILDSGPTDKIAAIMSFNNTTQHALQPRRIVIMQNSGREQFIPTYSHLWEPLSYPLLFPHGTLGWER